MGYIFPSDLENHQTTSGKHVFLLLSSMFPQKKSHKIQDHDLESILLFPCSPLAPLPWNQSSCASIFIYYPRKMVGCYGRNLPKGLPVDDMFYVLETQTCCCWLIRATTINRRSCFCFRCLCKHRGARGAAAFTSLGTWAIGGAFQTLAGTGVWESRCLWAVSFWVTEWIYKTWYD